jgi:small subunit ribosomal protein S9
MDEVKKEKAGNYIYTVGRRKSAIARIRLYNTGAKVLVDGVEYKKGDVIVNKKTITEYFSYAPYAPRYNKILVDTDTAGKFIITAKVVGGGQSAQIDAVVHGLARALDKLDTEKYHAILKERDYLTRDPRERERRKVGNAGKARRKKSSPKR